MRRSRAPCTLRLGPCALLFLPAFPLVSQSASRLELGVLEETNLARRDPAAYARHLEEMLGWFRGDVMYRPGDQVGIRTQEGPAAVREAIAFLRRQTPLAPLTWAPGLWRAARDHAADQGPAGRTGHDGADGSTMSDRMARYGRWQGAAAENIDYGSDDARQVVISLIVDDGVPSRGHRATIFNAQLRVAGVGCGPHRQYRHMCVMDYAAGFAETAAAPSTFLTTPWKRILPGGT